MDLTEVWLYTAKCIFQVCAADAQCIINMHEANLRVKFVKCLGVLCACIHYYFDDCIYKCTK